MTKNCKEANEKSTNGYRNKTNDGLNLVMQEKVKNDERNREWPERKEKPKMAITQAKGQKIGC